MIIEEKWIKINGSDKKNKYIKLKKYKDKDFYVKSDDKDEETTAFIKAFNEKDLKKRYEYIYDYMCMFLDRDVCSLCGFKNDRCKGNRAKTSVHEKDGCCYFKNQGFCTLFKNKKCTNPNISCKLFMCELVEKEMGFKSIPKNYLLLNFFFNRRQQMILQHSYRVKKEITINKLIKNRSGR